MIRKESDNGIKKFFAGLNSMQKLIKLNQMAYN